MARGQVASPTEDRNPHYYAFDLLRLDGRDLMREPLRERREALASVVRDTRVFLSDALPGTPAQIESLIRDDHFQDEEHTASVRRARCVADRCSRACSRILNVDGIL